MAVPVNENGNPTRSDTFPLIDGGQWAPRSAGSGSGDVFVNQRWNFNVNGAYQLPWDMEVAGNLFGKQGTPYPYFRQRGARPRGHVAHPAQRGARHQSVRRRCGTSTCAGRRTSRFGGRGSVQFIADLFNVMNSNTEITRERNAASPTTFRVLGSNLSPRILRFGVRLNF